MAAMIIVAVALDCDRREAAEHAVALTETVRR